jgi:hypothetical protein
VTVGDENGTIRRFRLQTTRQTETPDVASSEADYTIELVPSLTTLLLPDKEAATLTAAGRLVSSSPEFESAVVYLIETDDGRYEMLTPKQFNARVASTTLRNSVP